MRGQPGQPPRIVSVAVGNHVRGYNGWLRLVVGDAETDLQACVHRHPETAAARACARDLATQIAAARVE